jgi:ubiquinol-cytochrome c reductase cytochrome b subunit
MLVSIMAHLLRVFFTGAYRKPREVTWLIGVTMFALAMIEGFLGYSLPDDQLSGTGIRIAEGVLEGVPVAGTYLTFFLFVGQFPGTEFISRFYVIHVLLIPGLIAALLTAHLAAVVVQKHTQMPAHGRTNRNVVGPPVYPNDHVQSLPPHHAPVDQGASDARGLQPVRAVRGQRPIRQSYRCGHR